MNIANRCNSQIGGALENLKPASPQERAALEGAALLCRAFTFSMWVKKILILHTPQIPKGKYLLSALPFPSQAEVVALPGFQKGRGKTLQRGVLGITLAFPCSSADRAPGML